jgi:hypothetical protein
MTNIDDAIIANKLRGSKVKNLDKMYPLFEGTSEFLKTKNLLWSLSLKGYPHHKKKRIRNKYLKKIRAENARRVLSLSILTRKLDYNAIARRVFTIQPLPRPAYLESVTSEM